MGKDKKKSSKKDSSKKAQKKDKKLKKHKKDKKDKKEKKDKKDTVSGRVVKVDLSMDDYFLRSDHFRVWLKLVKQLAFDTLRTEETRSLFEGTSSRILLLVSGHILNPLYPLFRIHFGLQ